VEKLILPCRRGLSGVFGIFWALVLVTWSPPTPVRGADLFRTVTKSSEKDRITKALKDLDAYEAQAWLHSLEQSRIFLEINRMEEGQATADSVLPATGEDLERTHAMIAKAMQVEKDGGPPAGQTLARAVGEGTLRVLAIEPGNGKEHLRVTRYYSAKVRARKKKDKTFSRALYRLPPESHRDSTGRLPTKQQIHAGVLEGKAEDIAWLTPLDEAAVQMQGSGLLVFSESEVTSINYEGNNGYPWTDEDEAAKSQIRREFGEVTMKYWTRYKKRHTFHRHLNLDDFKHLKLLPGQFLGFDKPFERKMPVTARVSAAMDPGMIAPASIGLLISPEGRNRLVKVDDQGAAFIDRPDKIDLFWGSYTRNELQSGMTEDGKPVGIYPDWADLFFLVAARPDQTGVVPVTTP